MNFIKEMMAWAAAIGMWVLLAWGYIFNCKLAYKSQWKKFSNAVDRHKDIEIIGTWYFIEEREGKKQIMPKMPLKGVAMTGLATLVICIIAVSIGSEWIVGYAALFLILVVPYFVETHVESDWSYKAKHHIPILFKGKEYYLIKK